MDVHAWQLVTEGRKSTCARNMGDEENPKQGMSLELRPVNLACRSIAPEGRADQLLQSQTIGQKSDGGVYQASRQGTYMTSF